MNNLYRTINHNTLQTGALTVSLDGYIRMSSLSFMELPLQHFLSGLDDDTASLAAEDGTQALISGYTEWLSGSTPAVTIGWDWHLDLTCGRPCYVRVGRPRSNVMLIDADNGRDLGDEATSDLAIVKIDQFGWEDDVRDHISMRYA